MDPLFTPNEIVAILVTAAALAVFAGAARYAWREAAAQIAAGGSLRFHRFLERRGIGLAAIDDERRLRAAASAVRRCLTCDHQAACDAWLADEGRRGEAPPDCPNAAIVDALVRR